MPDSDEIALAVGLLRQGGVVAFPTETVYGLGADALNPAAVQRIFTIKGRPQHHPLIVHLADVSQLAEWARDIPPDAYALAEHFWPGPLTLILKRAARVPDSVTGGQDTIGLRVPNHPVALALLRQFAGGIAAPSANRFGRISPTRKEHVSAELGDAVGLILEGGWCSVGLEWTIVNLTSATPAILRPGHISAAALAEVLGKPVTGHGSAEPAGPRASGMLESHYAPRTPLPLIPTQQLLQEVSALLAFARRVAVLELERTPSKVPYLERGVYHYIMPNTPEEYARRLYATLREADAQGCDFLFVEQPPEDEAWSAINDRLRRAANAHKAA